MRSRPDLARLTTIIPLLFLGCELPDAGRAGGEEAVDRVAAGAVIPTLDSARVAYAADPDDAEALIWLGRHLAYAGRYEEAIASFTEGVERHPGDARFYRHRGHRFITTRELGRAIEDLERAASLVRGQPDRVEPDGLPNPAGIPRSTLQTNIWYHLALARYLARDFEGAARAWERGLAISENDDMRVANADWLWLTLMRMGRTDDADRVLETVRTDMDILENHAYHRRLLMYSGALDPDSLVPAGVSLAGSRGAAPPADEAADEIALALATYGYGLGQWHLLRGDTAVAVRVFRRVLDTGYESAFGFMAAAAELRALRPTDSEPRP